MQIRLPLPAEETSPQKQTLPYQVRLKKVLSGDLDFHGYNSAYASHNFHAFPAKFPPQLPGKFIEWLTEPGDIVLDPMMGSGTTILEAFLAGRRGIGLDIDPLALRLCRTKVTPTDIEKIAQAGARVLSNAEQTLYRREAELTHFLQSRFDNNTRKFVDYWFLPQTQMELAALIREIEQVTPQAVRQFLELVFSAIIITKSGGVSMARDLAHTRPHRDTSKKPRSAITQYRQKLQKNIQSLATLAHGSGSVSLFEGNAQALPLSSNRVDLIVTSPPYAANAIDYMRAHKFSLVWLGHPLSELANLRRQYIGGETLTDFQLLPMPEYAARVIAKIAGYDVKKSRVLHRYYSEMTRALAEMYRVLKPGKVAIVVVGTSTMRGQNTETHTCLAEIGETLGFEVVDIAVRHLDRDKRMMPARRNATANSQIEERMYEEYIIAFQKPSG